MKTEQAIAFVKQVAALELFEESDAERDEDNADGVSYEWLTSKLTHTATPGSRPTRMQRNGAMAPWLWFCPTHIARRHRRMLTPGSLTVT